MSPSTPTLAHIGARVLARVMSRVMAAVMARAFALAALLCAVPAMDPLRADATPNDPARGDHPHETDGHEDEHDHDHDHDHGDDHGQDQDEDQDQDHGHDHPIETVIVQATRSGRALDEEPVRVEVIVQEEIEEKALMRPGNISMLVAETGGVRVQTTSPALGAANIRLQGLYGRYTQLLSDGLPLYGGQAPSLGLLQVPPTDLARVEIIKGSASSLYGGSALGGVINLMSRQPGDTAEGEVLLNATTRDGQDLTGYFAAPLDERFAASLTVGAHHQDAQDFDDDGWIDMAAYERVSARPRLFWDGADGASLYATLGVMDESRQGGTLPGATVPDGNPFPRDQDTQRYDGGFDFRKPLSAAWASGGGLDWNVRGSAMRQDHEHVFGDVTEIDRHESLLLETSLSEVAGGGGSPWGGGASPWGGTGWVVGLAFQSERFASATFPAFDYDYDIPGVFVEIDQDLGPATALALSARWDDHSEYGSQLSPRLALLHRPGDWTLRASWGQGYFAPTPFVEEIEASGLSRLEPLAGLREESAQTASLDVGYRRDVLEANLTLFASNVDRVTNLEPFAATPGGPLDRVRLVNALGATRIRGSEVLLRYFWNDLKLTASYLYLDATERDPQTGGRREVALTPEHSAGFVAMWERHGRGRLGFEAYYTGVQRLDDNPYRDEGDAWWHLGLLGEITIGRVSWFINLENLLDVRQTREDPLLLPTRSPEGQWTTDIWSRNDGFIVNGGFRVRFGG